MLIEEGQKVNIKWGIYELTRELLAYFATDNIKLWNEAFERSRDRSRGSRIPPFYLVPGGKYV